MSIAQFFSTIKESHFNLIEVFNKAPNESLIALLIVVIIVLIALFFIIRTYKTNDLINIINRIQDASSYDDYHDKISEIALEIPKRGQKVAQLLSDSKEKILFRISKLLGSFSIKEKIEAYKALSYNYALIAKGVKKYNNNSLTNFYERKSKELLDKTLLSEIEHYYKSVDLSVDEVENIKALVEYIESIDNKNLVYESILNEFKRFSFGYNLDLFKFYEKLDVKSGKDIYKFFKVKYDEIEKSGEKELSINILEYLLNSSQEQKAYDYISNLKIPSYLQQLHDLLFDKKDDINLDLAFIANPLKINSDYKNYIDVSLTKNWKDSKHIEFISNAKGVLETLGHIEFRTLIERVDTIAVNEENKKVAQEALKIAKRAESIALEAKSLNKVGK